jgi:hypothetical protein
MGSNNWGQIHINLVNKWGQIHINLVNKWGQIHINFLAAQASVNHKKINVDLTPFIGN